MHRLALVVVSLVAAAACNEANPNSCELPQNAGTGECPPDTGGPCQSSNECTATADSPVCDLLDNGGTCVHCTASEHSLCTGMTPRCEAHACVACVDDGDCGSSGVCLTTGDCAAADRIIHAKVTGGIANGCGSAGNECSLAKALTEVTATRNIIKLDDPAPAVYSANGYTVMSEVLIDARNAIIVRSDTGPILTINGNGIATILGGTIRGATGANGDGIRCQSNSTLTVNRTTIEQNDESAIDASSCTLTVTGAKILGNGKRTNDFYAGIVVDDGTVTITQSWIASNRGGGLTNNRARFLIVGNVFLDNGVAAGTAFGGVFIMSTMPGSRFDFNTIAENNSQATVAAGVQCTAAAGFVARYNIVWNNNSVQGITADQVDGGCSYAYSDIGTAPVPPLLDSGNNMTIEPSFINELTDLHLQPQSMVRRAADQGADLGGLAERDIDGDRRVPKADLGADQTP